MEATWQAHEKPVALKGNVYVSTYGQTKDSTGGTFLSSYARTLTNGGLRFHTDRTDVVGLLCVRQAMKGGVSTLASTSRSWARLSIWALS